jgi:hypothetical protein
MGTQKTHISNKRDNRTNPFAILTYPNWAVADVIFVGGPLIIYPVGAPTPLPIGNTLDK